VSWKGFTRRPSWDSFALCVEAEKGAASDAECRGPLRTRKRLHDRLDRPEYAFYLEEYAERCAAVNRPRSGRSRRCRAWRWELCEWRVALRLSSGGCGIGDHADVGSHEDLRGFVLLRALERRWVFGFGLPIAPRLWSSAMIVRTRSAFSASRSVSATILEYSSRSSSVDFLESSSGTHRLRRACVKADFPPRAPTSC
jgi:hypothetical protein